MSTLPLVSIIIPTYQCGYILTRAIESVLSQTYPAVELIVVNDGSSDNTDEVIQPYLDKLVYIKQETNKGITVAYNTGMRAAKGQYVGTLGADDYYLPERLRLIMAVFAVEKRCFVTTDYFREVAGEEGNWLPPVYELQGEQFQLGANEQLLRALERNFIFCQGIMPRTMLDEIGLYDETLSCNEDWDMWLRGLAAGYRAALVPVPLSVYTISRHGSLTWGNTLQKVKDNKRILAKHKQTVPHGAYRLAEGAAAWSTMRAAQVTGHNSTALKCALEVISNGPYLKDRLIPKLLTYFRPSSRR